MRRASLCTSLCLSLVSSLSAGETHTLPGFTSEFAVQDRSKLCWAACIQMSMRQAGHKISQEDIVRTIHGANVNEPIPFDEMESAFASIAAKTNVLVRVLPTKSTLTNVQLIECIDRGRPILAAVAPDSSPIPSHLIIIYGYEIDDSNALYYLFFDPWPGKGRGRQKFIGAESWRYTVEVLIPPRTVEQSSDPFAARWLDPHPIDANFNKSQENRTVVIDQKVTNTHPSLPIDASIALVSAYGPRADPSSDLTEHERRRFSVRILPRETWHSRAKLYWFASAEDMPIATRDIESAQFATPPTQADKEAEESAMESDFRKVLASSNNMFEDIRGDSEGSDKESDDYKVRVPIAGWNRISLSRSKSSGDTVLTAVAFRAPEDVAANHEFSRLDTVMTRVLVEEWTREETSEDYKSFLTKTTRFSHPDGRNAWIELNRSKKSKRNTIRFHFSVGA